MNEAKRESLRRVSLLVEPSTTGNLHFRKDFGLEFNSVYFDPALAVPSLTLSNGNRTVRSNDPFVSTVILNHWFFTSTYLAQLNEDSDDEERSVDVSTSEESGSSLASQEHKKKPEPLMGGQTQLDQGDVHATTMHHNNSMDSIHIHKHTALSHYQYQYQHQQQQQQLHKSNPSSSYHSTHPHHQVSFDDDAIDIKTSNNNNNNNNKIIIIIIIIIITYQTHCFRQCDHKHKATVKPFPKRTTRKHPALTRGTTLCITIPIITTAVNLSLCSKPNPIKLESLS
ncbi:hypothetical protein RFI_08533, partial [Reticulomyxa filosa]